MAANDPALPRIRRGKDRGVDREEYIVGLVAAVRVRVLPSVVRPTVAIVHLGFGHIVASEIDVPNMSVKML